MSDHQASETDRLIQMKKKTLEIIKHAAASRVREDFEHANDACSELKTIDKTDPEVTAALAFVDYLRGDFFLASTAIDLAREQYKTRGWPNDGFLDELETAVNKSIIKIVTHRQNRYAPRQRLDLRS